MWEKWRCRIGTCFDPICSVSRNPADTVPHPKDINHNMKLLSVANILAVKP
jgi:hypothetical protein